MFLGWLLVVLSFPLLLIACSIERARCVSTIFQPPRMSVGHLPVSRSTLKDRRRDTDVKPITFLPVGWGLFGSTVYLAWWFLFEVGSPLMRLWNGSALLWFFFTSTVPWFRWVILPRIKKPPDRKIPWMVRRWVVRLWYTLWDKLSPVPPVSPPFSPSVGSQDMREPSCLDCSTSCPHCADHLPRVFSLSFLIHRRWHPTSANR